MGKGAVSFTLTAERWGEGEGLCDFASFETLCSSSLSSAGLLETRAPAVPSAASAAALPLELLREAASAIALGSWRRPGSPGAAADAAVRAPSATSAPSSPNLSFKIIPI